MNKLSTLSIAILVATSAPAFAAKAPSTAALVARLAALESALTAANAKINTLQAKVNSIPAPTPAVNIAPLTAKVLNAEQTINSLVDQMRALNEGADSVVTLTADMQTLKSQVTDVAMSPFMVEVASRMHYDAQTNAIVIEAHNLFQQRDPNPNMLNLIGSPYQFDVSSPTPAPTRTRMPVYPVDKDWLGNVLTYIDSNGTLYNNWMLPADDYGHFPQAVMGGWEYPNKDGVYPTNATHNPGNTAYPAGGLFDSNYHVLGNYGYPDCNGVYRTSANYKKGC
jgi:hypothetical protein